MICALRRDLLLVRFMFISFKQFTLKSKFFSLCDVESAPASYEKNFLHTLVLVGSISPFNFTFNLLICKFPLPLHLTLPKFFRKLYYVMDSDL